MAIDLQRICRYPVKGLSPESLDSVTLAPGEGLPDDRRFALAHGANRYESRTGWLPKRHFLNLMINERLATLETRYESDSGILTIRRKGRQVARGNITQQIGRDLIDQFFAAFMRDESVRSPRLVESPGVMFSDVNEKFVSIISLNSVRDLERVTRRPVDPLRFRGNLMIAGGRPWEELDWVGKELRIGAVTLSVAEPIGRCAATNVDPASGERDMNIPKTLVSGFGHHHCGVYARVTSGGSVAPGDPVTVSGA